MPAGSIFPIFFAGGTPVAGDWQVTILPSHTKHQPTVEPAVVSSLNVTTCRGKWASWQVAITAIGGDLSTVNVSATTPTGCANLTIYREIQYNCARASRTDGAAGEWPDALVPKVDPLYGETRSNAFPFDISLISPPYLRFGNSVGMESPLRRIPTFGMSRPTIAGTYDGTTLRNYHIEIDTGGGLGTATFRWSDTGGATWNATGVSIPSTAAISLNHGLTVSFPDQTYTVNTLDSFQIYDASVPSYAGYLANANSVAAADIPIEGAIGDMMYFGGNSKFYNLDILLSTAGIGGTFAWEYWNGYDWVSFVSYGEIESEVGSLNLTSLINKINFTNTSTWSTTAVNGTTAYWVRARVTAGYSTVPVGTQIITGFDAWEFFVDDHRTELVWIECYVPETHDTGTVTSTVTVSASGKTSVDLDANLIVKSAVIPIVPTFPTWYIAFRQQIVQGLDGRSYDTNSDNDLMAKVQVLGLRNRMTISGLAPYFGWNGSTIDSRWDNYFVTWIRPFLEGTSDWPSRIAFLESRVDNWSLHIKFHVYGTIVYGSAPDYDLTADEKFYLTKFYEKLANEGWEDYYYCNNVEEPQWGGGSPPSRFTNGVVNSGNSIHTANSTFKTVCSSPYQSAWTGGPVDIWNAPIYDFGILPRSLYDTEVARGAKVWSYRGIMGLYEQFGIPANKWPVDDIDHDSPKLRGYYWLSYDNGIHGDLNCGVSTSWYAYSTSCTTPGRYDPWDQYAWYKSFGNGEGTFLWPGRASARCGAWYPNGIGGTHNVPLESIRLKQIREGLEEIEVFKLVAALGYEDNLKTKIEEAVGDDLYYWDTPPSGSTLDTKFAEILDMFETPTPPIPPGLSYLAVSIDGEDRTEIILQNSIEITRSLDNRGTCRIGFRDDTRTWHPQPGEQVTVSWNGEVIFGGKIESVDERLPRWADGPLFIEIDATDWSRIFDRFLVAASYEITDDHPDPWTLSEIVTDIINDPEITPLGTEEGITIGTIPTFSFNGAVKFKYSRVSDCLRDLCEAGGYSWTVSPLKVLTIYDRSLHVAPWTIGEGVGAFETYRNLKKRRSIEQYRNRQWLLAGKDITGWLYEYFHGDTTTAVPEKKSRTFTLAYPMANCIPVITRGSTVQRLGIRGIDKDGDLTVLNWSQWFYKVGENQVSQNSASDETNNPTLGPNETLEVKYKGAFDCVVLEVDEDHVDERIAIEGGSGIYESAEEDQKLDTRDLASERARRLLEQFGRVPATLQYQIDRSGLEPGHLQTITIADLDVNAQFLVEEVRYTFPKFDLMRVDVSVLDGERQEGWTDFWRRTMQIGRVFSIRENEVIAKYLRREETVAITDSLKENIHDSVTVPAIEEDPYTVALLGVYQVPDGQIVGLARIGWSKIGAPVASP